MGARPARRPLPDPRPRARTPAPSPRTCSCSRRSARRSAGRCSRAARSGVASSMEPDPAPVTTGRATVIDVGSPFASEADGAGWLAAAGEDELAADLAVLNRVLYAFRLVIRRSVRRAGRAPPDAGREDRLRSGRRGRGRALDRGSRAAGPRAPPAPQGGAGAPGAARGAALEPRASRWRARSSRSARAWTSTRAATARPPSRCWSRSTRRSRSSTGDPLPRSSPGPAGRAPRAARPGRGDRADRARRARSAREDLETVVFVLGRIEAALRARTCRRLARRAQSAPSASRSASSSATTSPPIRTAASAVERRRALGQDRELAARARASPRAAARPDRPRARSRRTASGRPRGQLLGAAQRVLRQVLAEQHHVGLQRPSRSRSAASAPGRSRAGNGPRRSEAPATLQARRVRDRPVHLDQLPEPARACSRSTFCVITASSRPSRSSSASTSCARLGCLSSSVWKRSP